MDLNEKLGLHPEIDIQVTPRKIQHFQGKIPEYQLDILAGEGRAITDEDLRRAKAIKDQLTKGMKESADLCKKSPDVCERNLGIPRSEMPQIPERSIKELLASKESSDRKKGQAMVAAGADPKANQPFLESFLEWLQTEGVSVDTAGSERVAVERLKATQAEIRADKTFGMADNYLKGEYDPTEGAIVISKDNHILDGHHRWAAMLLVDPLATFPVIRVGLTMRKLLTKAFEMPGVFRVDIQDNVIPNEGTSPNRKASLTRTEYNLLSGWTFCT